MTIQDAKKGALLVKLAPAIAAFVDELLPGGNGWPSGATIGVQFPLAERLIEQNGEQALMALAETLDRIGAPFDGMDADARVEAVKTLEASEPDRFGWLRDAAFQPTFPK